MRLQEFSLVLEVGHQSVVAQRAKSCVNWISFRSGTHNPFESKKLFFP